MRTRQQFDSDLAELEKRLICMGEIATTMLGRAMEALVQGDNRIVEDLLRQDDEVDDYNIAIENECMRLIIQQQPMAHDLRFVGMVFKAITDIERIADHAVDIAKIARHITNETRYEPVVDVPLLAGMVQAMFSDALKAFGEHDVRLAAQVISADDAVDELFHAQRSELHRLMESDSTRILLASYLVFVTQFLERVGDRCVNIAERVLKIERGLQALSGDDLSSLIN